ncbi:hypothetical protein CEXT_573201 [Caerostris extrusa]|uniref:Uncharacterized protein n=1 Tax=Caerostris extrusa TaxID=172846 RepID=A0AAV4VQH6_CAEEX|nr:hypothetical protein CEXT_573201 [Caerostris extrusa]
MGKLLLCVNFVPGAIRNLERISLGSVSEVSNLSPTASVFYHPFPLVAPKWAMIPSFFQTKEPKPYILCTNRAESKGKREFPYYGTPRTLTVEKFTEDLLQQANVLDVRTSIYSSEVCRMVPRNMKCTEKHLSKIVLNP